MVSQKSTLKERYEEFTYKVTTSVPQDATAFSVSDTLVPVLEFSGEKGQATATLDGQELMPTVSTLQTKQSLWL